MEISKDITIKLQELQLLERNLQTFSMEKQSSQVELNEIDNALSELNKSSDEVYKIISGIMIRSEKSLIIKELTEKKKILNLKISTIEKNEAPLEQKAENLRKEINSSMSKSK